MRSKGYKCSNVKCNSCIAHCMCGEPGDVAVNCVDRIIARQTNNGRIRAIKQEKKENLVEETMNIIKSDGYRVRKIIDGSVVTYEISWGLED